MSRVSPVGDVTRVEGPGLGRGVTVAPELGGEAGAPGVTVAAAPEVLLPLPVPGPGPVEVLLLPPATPPAQALVTRVQGGSLTVVPSITLSSRVTCHLGHTSHTARTRLT